MKLAKLITAAVLVAGVAAPVGHAAAELYFRTPNRNIECAMFEPRQADIGNVTCIVRSTATPRKPWLAWSLDSWQHVAVYRSKNGVVATPVRTLGYGQTLRRGFFRCTSRQAGLTCISLDSRHGFVLGRARQRTF
jgi:hypothetical protein